MSPNNKKKLYQIRAELDKLDNRLLLLIKKRTYLVDEVVKLKQFKKEIVDKQRIKIILSKIKYKSKKLNIDTNITKRIWKNMIWSYINYERKNFKKK
jgi:chorismate mutase|tara:strand:+ start:1022 stop:1312 length:291 start_codon:yes stop_codon:yes gene_type:complete